MARQGPRLHRLPQRLDYPLIPAPLDLSLPSITEKSPLPAIIVTPSSPIHTHDFSIAFLAPPTKPSVRERVSSSIDYFTSKSWLTQSRPIRTFFILTVLFFVMITTHLITHRFAAYPYPRLDSEFAHRRLANGPSTGLASATSQQANANLGVKVGVWNWIGFEFRKTWGVRGGVVIEDTVVIGGTVSELSGLD